MTGDPDVRFLELTPVQRRRLHTSLEIHESPAQRIAYQHTVLCQTCLPYRDPGSAVRLWERQQGIASLRIEAGAARNPQTREFVELGLPYGARPRLILTHLNSEALKLGSPRIEVESSLSAFVRRIQNRPPTGREVRRFKDQLSRLAAAVVRFAIDLSRDRAFQVQTTIIDAFELWLSKDERQRVLWPAVVELSPDTSTVSPAMRCPLMSERSLGWQIPPLPWTSTPGWHNGFIGCPPAGRSGSAGRRCMLISATGTGISASSEPTSKRCWRWCTRTIRRQSFRSPTLGLSCGRAALPFPTGWRWCVSPWFDESCPRAFGDASHVPLVTPPTEICGFGHVPLVTHRPLVKYL